MADEPAQGGPSLEMPSFSLRRRRRPSAAPEGGEHVLETAAAPPTTVLPPSPEPPTGTAEARPRSPMLPSMGGLPAAVLTGVLVGGLALALAWLAGTACEAARGTSSCGGAAGLPILLAALAVMAYAGALLLALFGIDDAGSTSLLAVGVLAVLVMVFLLGSLDEPWTLVAVPAASALAYAGAWWVTATVGAESTESTGSAETPGPVSRDVR